MSRNKVNQEHDEMFYLKQFSSLMDFQGAIVNRGGDPPDYVVSVYGKTIAVEITEFHSNVTGENGVPRRAIEETWKALRNTIIKERKDFTELNDISCILFFDKFIMPPKKIHVPFVKELLSFIKYKLNEIFEVQKEYNAFPGDKILLSKYLKGVLIQKVKCRIPWEWNRSAGMVGLNEPELQKIVASKSYLIESSCDEIWLLIVSGHEISQSMGLPHIDELNEFISVSDILRQSSYTRVYIFQYTFGRILEWTKDGIWKVRVRSEDFNR